MLPEGILAGTKKSRGILIYGPPGSGKTLMAHAIAGETQLPLIEVHAASLISGICGGTEKNICDVFEKALNSSPCILFLDQVDAIASKRELASREEDRRVVSMLLKFIDDLNTEHVDSKILVIGATNTPDALDTAFRTGWRFDIEVGIGIPNEAARISILRVMCRDLQLPPGSELSWIAKRTAGFVGADLGGVVRRAAKEATYRAYQKLFRIHVFDSDMRRKFTYFMEQEGLQVNDVGEVPKDSIIALKVEKAKMRAILSVMRSDPGSYDEKLTEGFHIEIEDFEVALDTCGPLCLKSEGFSAIPNKTWKEVGALKGVKEALEQSVVWPVKHKAIFDKLKCMRPSGVLLWGPTGCGKTLVATALANECCMNFLYVKSPELLYMFDGKTERAVKQVFQRARDSAPCVLLFDQLNTLCPPRFTLYGNAPTDRGHNQLLIEIDALEQSQQVFVIGITNRLDAIDSSMLRYGRLEEKVFVGLPTPQERIDILKTVTKNGTEPHLADDVDIERLAVHSRCDNFSGADLGYLVKKASLEALEDYFARSGDGIKDSKAEVSLAHFHRALSKIKPSVPEEEREYYERVRLEEG